MGRGSVNNYEHSYFATRYILQFFRCMYHNLRNSTNGTYTYTAKSLCIDACYNLFRNTSNRNHLYLRNSGKSVKISIIIGDTHLEMSCCKYGPPYLTNRPPDPFRNNSATFVRTPNRHVSAPS
uniref:Uncharacterized protein n=1 Tax=Photinus pyralis TaxID=7054 RepID=A0A1Y1MY48_PHOPY